MTSPYLLVMPDIETEIAHPHKAAVRSELIVPRTASDDVQSEYWTQKGHRFLMISPHDIEILGSKATTK